jgi:hypothetical protein
MEQQEILDYCRKNPREYTYVGVGSKNRYDDLEKFIPEIDQILPRFLDDVTKTLRVIHFDQEFDKSPAFLDRYFKSKGLIKDGYFTWRSPCYRIEVIVNPVNLYGDLFFQDMINQAIQFNSQLVVQRYNGDELLNQFNKLYSQFSAKHQAYIKKNVLFDFTYGTDCHCDTPMLKHAPLVAADGTFFNFTLFAENEMFGLIGVNPRMDALIEIYVNRKLSRILNEDHVNYRRATKNEPLMFKSTDYADNATPEEIMNFLLNKVSGILEILHKLGKLSPERQAVFDTCSKNYMETDMYKWYTEMTKLYK